MAIPIIKCIVKLSFIEISTVVPKITLHNIFLSKHYILPLYDDRSFEPNFIKSRDGVYNYVVVSHTTQVFHSNAYDKRTTDLVTNNTSYIITFPVTIIVTISLSFQLYYICISFYNHLNAMIIKERYLDLCCFELVGTFKVLWYDLVQCIFVLY